MGVNSVMAAAVISQLGYRAGALTLDGAERDDLDRYAYDRYNLARKGASGARTYVVISRTSTAAGAGSVPIGTRVATDTGIEYETTTIAAFGSSDFASRANVRAAQAGKQTQAGALAIKRFSQPSNLFDRTLTCTNPEAAAGGEDAESDDLFKARIRDFWRTARRGILAAIEFGAKTVPGVVSAMALEGLTNGGQPARVVNLYIADSSGVSSTVLASEVVSALDEYRAAGIAVIVWTSLPLLVDIVLRLTFRANVDTATLTDNVVSAIIEYVNSIPVNGTLEIAGLYSVLKRYSEDGLIVDQGTIVSPAGDLVPDAGQTIRTTAGNVSLAA